MVGFGCMIVTKFGGLVVIGSCISAMKMGDCWIPMVLAKINDQGPPESLLEALI